MGVESCIAVDIGGTKMLVAEVLRDGTIVNSLRLATGDIGKDEILWLTVQGVKEYENSIGWKEGKRPKQLGAGINGVIDPAAGLWKKMGEDDCELAFAAGIEKQLGVKCFIDNDVKAAVMAETLFGAAKGCRDVVYVNVGTGLAAGIMANGRVIRGTDGFAGEVGFMNFTGGKGERVEMLASGMGIRYQARQLIGKYPDSGLKDSVETGVTGQELFECAREKDPMAERIVNSLAEMTGLLISNLTCVLSPEIVVLGGGLISEESMLERICSCVSKKALQHLEKGIVLTGLKPAWAGLLGAAAVGLGYQEQFGNE